jgi:hypothetical protein
MLVYSTKTMTLRLIDLDNPQGRMHLIYLSDRENGYFYHNQPNSVKISGDNKEIIAGTTKSELYLYDVS